MALILANSMFGLGSIIGALGLPETNPLVFTFVREVFAGIILFGLSYYFVMKTSDMNKAMRKTNALKSPIDADDNHLLHYQNCPQNEEDNNRNNNTIKDTTTNTFLLFPQRQHYRKYAMLGILLFGNQSAYIVGLQTAGPVTGSIWQPSSPIFTAALSMIWGLESWNLYRIVGVFVAFGGCTAMVFLSDRDQDTTHGGTTAFIIGNFLYLTNCTCTAVFILLSKEVLQHYSSLTVIAWSYLLASPFMATAAYLSSKLPNFAHLICPTCLSTDRAFSIPVEAIPALAYYIIAMSVGSWGFMLYANQYATGTLVMGYNVMQPVTAIIFTALLLWTGFVSNCTNEESTDGEQCLNEPGLGTFCGMVGVACGLALIISTEPSTNKPVESQNHEDETSDVVMTNTDNDQYGTIP